MKPEFQRYDNEGLPILHPEDLKQFDRYGIYGLKKKGLYGILERLEKAGIINVDIRRIEK